MPYYQNRCHEPFGRTSPVQSSLGEWIPAVADSYPNRNNRREAERTTTYYRALASRYHLRNAIAGPRLNLQVVVILRHDAKFRPSFDIGRNGGKQLFPITGLWRCLRLMTDKGRMYWLERILVTTHAIRRLRTWREFWVCPSLLPLIFDILRTAHPNVRPRRVLGWIL